MSIPTSVRRRTLSIEDYHKMGLAGIFHPDERIELIEGELIAMAPIRGPHMRVVNVLTRMLSLQTGDAALVSIQNPVLLPPHSEPQPDIVLLPREFAKRNEVPDARDVLLVIEVADSTLVYDRDIKVPLYARFAIPEVWLIDAQAETLSIYLEPAANGYRCLLAPGKEEIVAPSRTPGMKIRLSEIWLH